MMRHPLKPFTLKADFSLDFEAERRAGGIHFEFRLSDFSQLKFPDLQPAPARKRRDELWRSTCFEIFVGAKDQTAYLEMNLSPTGDWNTYAFTNYRAGMSASADAVAPLVSLEKKNGVIIRGLLHSGESMRGPLALSAAAVLEYENGAIEYWALKHAGSRPDFHLRESFILAL
jgi:hypothetical protein